jgi:hypothetical protein
VEGAKETHLHIRRRGLGGVGKIGSLAGNRVRAGYRPALKKVRRDS